MTSYSELCVTYYRRNYGEPDFAAPDNFDLLARVYCESAEEWKPTYDLILKKTLEIMANPVKRPGWRCADPIKSSVFDVAVAGNPFREGFSCREPGTQGATSAVPDARRDLRPSAPSVRCPG